MRSSSRKLPLACVSLLVLGLCFAATEACALEIAIDVSPHVLNIQSNGTVVTVHTDISYSLVNAYTVYLNSVPIQSWKADDRGNFVAKFSMDDVKQLDGLVIGDYNTMQLVGVTTEGEPFVGEEDILVIDVPPQKK